MVADPDPAPDPSNVADGRPEADEHRYDAHQAHPYDAGQPLLGPRWGEVRRFAGPRVALAPFPGQGLGDYLADAHYKAEHVAVRDYGARTPDKRSAEQTLIGLCCGATTAPAGTPYKRACTTLCDPGMMPPRSGGHHPASPSTPRR